MKRQVGDDSQSISSRIDDFPQSGIDFLEDEDDDEWSVVWWVNILSFVLLKLAFEAFPVLLKIKLLNYVIFIIFFLEEFIILYIPKQVPVAV